MVRCLERRRRWGQTSAMFLVALPDDLLHRTSSILILDRHGPLVVAYLSTM